MQRDDWTLLAIALAGRTPMTPVQLQKTLFLLSKQMPNAVGDDFYDFRPYNYGPFDRQVYVDAEELSRKGLITIDTKNRFAEYSATHAGVEAARRLAAGATVAADYLSRIVLWAQSLSFQQLVRAIYAKYPEYRENSVFQY